MAKKLISIDLLLLVLAAFLVYELHSDIRQFNLENDLRKLKARHKTQSAMAQAKVSLPPARPSEPVPGIDSYMIIADKNLFVEERSKAKPEAEAKVIPELNPRPILLGTMITGDKPMALVEVNRGAQGAPPRKELVSIGKELQQGYIVTEITPEKIVLTYGSGERVETIRIFEPGKRQQAGAMGQAPMIPGQAPVFSGQPPVLPVVTPAQTSQPQVITIGAPPPPAQPAPIITPAQAVGEAAAPSQAAPGVIKGNRPAVEGGKKIIKTPFGDIQVPVQQQEKQQ